MPVRPCSARPNDLSALHRGRPGRYPFLLQTLAGEGWDILFAFPRARESWPVGMGVTPALTPSDGLPFEGGWFVYLAYELLHRFEPSVTLWREGGHPLSLAVRIPAAIQYRHRDGAAFLFAEAGQESLLDLMAADLADTMAVAGEAVAPNLLLQSLAEDDPLSFIGGVGRIRDYIREGDVFQVNLSREWRGTLDRGDASDVYAALARSNPAPFAALADFGDFQIASSSPERLVRVRDGRVDTRPIAGTTARHRDAEEDAAGRRELLRSAKEKAEHIMLVDLERNDLGRICRPGSVSVPELMSLCTYAHVHHIESVVQGQLSADVAFEDIIRAVFPGGTITGCPKVRTMQIIRELEVGPRMAYTGSLGYVNHDGSMEFNILIRTMMLAGKEFRFRTGAGIVADSDPERELAETRAKAKGLLLALGAA